MKCKFIHKDFELVREMRAIDVPSVGNIITLNKRNCYVNKKVFLIFDDMYHIWISDTK